MNIFHEFVGGFWRSGRSVTVYVDGDIVRLCLGPTGGSVVRTVTLARAEYDALRASWYAGGSGVGDALARARAMRYMLGYS